MVYANEQAGGVSLRNVLNGCRVLGASDVRVSSCCSDSRQVKPGDLFVALPGVENDGHEHVYEALQRGAAAFLVERPVPVGPRPSCLVSDVRVAYGQLCQALAGYPTRSLQAIGVTGTNGKTTTTALIRGVLRAAGARVGTIGTLGVWDGFDLHPAAHTTPPAHTLAMHLAEMVSNGCTHAVMEVSSHSLSQARIAGIELAAACFTNIRHDHLDYHGSLVNYQNAKSQLLQYVLPGGLVVFNADDSACVEIAGRASGKTLSIGVHADADLTATIIERHPSEQIFLLSFDCETAALRTQMIGEHHVYNCLMAAAVGLNYGIDFRTVVRGLESVVQVPGRMERIDCGQPFGVFVDYAHTPDALVTCLDSLRQVTPGRLLCVFGAGGDRDQAKRPLMGAAVERHADLTVITTDNPRGEDPQDIASQIRTGFRHPLGARVILDRAEAIEWALAEALPGDCVLIAGKGHEDYQQIGRHRYPFDDRQIAREFLYEQGCGDRATQDDSLETRSPKFGQA